MVSLKQYKKKEIINEVKHRFEKIASLLDDADFEDMLQQSISWLDQAVFSPRVILFKQDDIITYNGGYFVDVTPYKIDVINNVYYENSFDESFNTILPEVGIMPFIYGNYNFTNLSTVAEYLALRTNLNMISRQLDLDGDYELWPKDEEGRQLLQVKNNKMIKVEFLPNFDRDADSWTFYDSEYKALKDIIFDKCNLFNAEMQISATSLGIGKEASNLTDYWDKKLEADKKEFLDSVMITYMA